MASRTAEQEEHAVVASERLHTVANLIIASSIYDAAPQGYHGDRARS